MLQKAWRSPGRDRRKFGLPHALSFCFPIIQNVISPLGCQVLGRIVPELFPKIFGPEANMGLDRDAAVRALEALATEVNAYRGSSVAPLSADEL